MNITSIALACVLAAPALAQGRIVVAHDDWTLSNQGFGQAASTGQFALNVANWFTGGVPGNFRAWSQSFGLTESQLAQTMTGGGHTWTVSAVGTFDLATAQQYDALFLGGFVLDANVLTEYVLGGGNVYLFGGTGSDSGWNPFLANFGFKFDALNGITGVQAISSPHPLFAGVASLYQFNGSTVTDLEPANGTNQVLVASNNVGMFAVYDGQLPTIYCTAKTNSMGCVPSIGFAGSPSVSNAAPFTITAANVLNNKNGLLFYGYATASVPFQGGTLCVANPIRFTGMQHGAGNPPPSDCSGSYSVDMNAWIQSANDPQLVLGKQVFVQYWTRDVASASTTGLTDAIRFVVGA